MTLFPKLFLLVKVFCNTFHKTIFSIRTRIYEIAKRLRISEQGLQLHETALLVGHFTTDRFQCNGNSWIGAYSILLIGDDSLGGAKKGTFSCGSNVYIGDQCNIRAAGGPIAIGSDVLIANHVTIVASNHGLKLGIPVRLQEWADFPTGVIIENDCWIGANAVILPGAHIDTGAVVAAGAVVRGYIPKNEIWGGVPARKLGFRK